MFLFFHGFVLATSQVGEFYVEEYAVLLLFFCFGSVEKMQKEDTPIQTVELCHFMGGCGVLLLPSVAEAE